MDKSIVITTINPKSKSILEFEKLEDWNLVVVGDRRSAKIACSQNLLFLSLDDQLELEFAYPKRCPENHYARKNVGYLYSMSQGASVIYDTDDDNAPLSGWHMPAFNCRNALTATAKFVNVYHHFTNLPVWPRGFPLDEIRRVQLRLDRQNEAVKVGIWQGLANGDPDVDAIFRLTAGQSITFTNMASVYLPSAYYCPINSQNTFWKRELFPLMYLPAKVSFRFTDILRGYVAQRICWQHSFHVGFTGATVHQDRNEHDLMKDFESEVDCYLNVKRVVEVLDATELSSNMSTNLLACYEQLCAAGIVPNSELVLLEAWIGDLNSIYNGAAY